MVSPVNPNSPTLPARPSVDFLANALGALVGHLHEDLELAGRNTVGIGGGAPAALTWLLFANGSPIRALADVLGYTHPATVQLCDRLVAAGFVERRIGPDARTRLLRLTPKGRRTAQSVLNARAQLLQSRVASLNVSQQQSLRSTLDTLFSDAPIDVVTADHICRLCDETVCPESICPVGRAITTTDAPQ